MNKQQTGSRTRSFITRIFDVRGWTDWDRGKSTIIFITDTIKRLFILQPRKTTASTTSFNAAVKRYQLTPEQIEIKKIALWRLSMLMLTLGSLLSLYLIYQIIYGHILAILLSIVVTLIAFILAFRYHFWYFQMKQKKLGCTVREWFRQSILGGKP